MGEAVDAYRVAIAPQTREGDKEIIRHQLLKYCELDTYAMVRLWQIFAQRQDTKL